jgi:hypothetical protein
LLTTRLSPTGQDFPAVVPSFGLTTHPLPGLREQLQKANSWKPGADKPAEPAKPAQ